METTQRRDVSGMSVGRASIDRLQLQKDEFDAMFNLSIAYNALPAVVDDDYPMQRQKYEAALKDFVAALTANGRFPPRDRKLTVKAAKLPGGTRLALFDSEGELLPNQTDVVLVQKIDDAPRIAVTFVIDGRIISMEGSLP